MGEQKVSESISCLEAIEASSNGVLVINHKGEIVFHNQAALRLIGRTGEDLRGTRITEIVPNSRLGQVLRQNQAHSDQIIIGNRKLFTNRSPIYKDGNIVGAVAVFQDGSESQELLTRLNATQSMLTSLENIFEQAYAGVMVVDTEGVIRKITNAYCNFLGIEPQDAVGRHATEIIPNSRMHIVAKNGIAEIGEAMEVRGKEAVVMRIPLRENGKLVGAFGQVMFRDLQQVRTLAEKLHLMEHKLRFYEKELQRYQRHRYTFNNIIGRSPVLLRAKELAEKAAQGKSTILLRGESGTGKEVFAHAIHAASSRAGEPFVRVNCGAIPAELLEAELFGYEEGAFTGAKKGGKPGKFELANRGTIFLDEIGDLPLPMQAKVLRVLQEKEVERVGSNSLMQLDIRVIAATHQDLEKMVSKGEFRSDLYYRLNVFTISIPPLRERQEDILLLSNHLLNKFNCELGVPVREIDSNVQELFLNYAWPGNVRELQNAIERAINVAEGNKICLEDLPLYLRDSKGRKEDNSVKTLALELAQAEKRAILMALKAAGGNKAKAAGILNIHRTNLYDKMKRHGIEQSKGLDDEV